MKSLLEDMEYPDMICIQEARLKALSEHSRGEPMPSEYAEVKPVVESVFQDYQPIWSLANTRYAGTVTFVHRRLTIDMASQCAFSVEAAVDLMLKRYQLTRTQLGLSIPPSPVKKAARQLSMKAFFAPKAATTCSSSSSVIPSGNHHPEGRFQFFAFPAMDVLQTYVPNNGTKEESFQRRREWDDSMLKFLQDRRKILAQANVPDRPLVWCGDFNCARDYRDGTHWEKRDDGSVYEFWTDSVKCQVGNSGVPSDPANVGIPSFTPNERRRFAQLLKEGGLVDVWREVHPDGTCDVSMKPWDRPNYTWRGHLARNGAPYSAKFQGKGQRLDYFLLSPANMMSSVFVCQILGSGEKRDGYFCGSDHCASILRLQAASLTP
jgi:exonuclease III